MEVEHESLCGAVTVLQASMIKLAQAVSRPQARQNVHFEIRPLAGVSTRQVGV